MRKILRFVELPFMLLGLIIWAIISLMRVYILGDRKFERDMIDIYEFMITSKEGEFTKELYLAGYFKYWFMLGVVFMLAIISLRVLL